MTTCLGVDEMVNDLDFNVFPNPFSNKFTITSAVNFEAQLHILNVLGEDVYSQVIKAKSTEINMSNIPKGIYFIQISTSQNTISRKIIKD